jgi:hypothetical protein
MLKRINAPEALINVARMALAPSKTSIHINGTSPFIFNSVTGVKQGCPERKEKRREEKRREEKRREEKRREEKRREEKRREEKRREEKRRGGGVAVVAVAVWRWWRRRCGSGVGGGGVMVVVVEEERKGERGKRKGEKEEREKIEKRREEKREEERRRTENDTVCQEIKFSPLAIKQSLKRLNLISIQAVYLLYFNKIIYCIFLLIFIHKSKYLMF